MFRNRNGMSVTYLTIFLNQALSDNSMVLVMFCRRHIRVLEKVKLKLFTKFRSVTDVNNEKKKK